MTANQILKALKQAGINTTEGAGILNIGRDTVEVCIVTPETQRANDRKTNALYRKVVKVLGWRGGYTTGYGGRVLQAKPIKMGDWNDKSSRWHY